MNKKLITVAGSVLVLGVGGLAVWHHHGHAGLDHDHSHEHGSMEGVKLELNDGQKWATDAPLRQGMDVLHKEIVPLYKAHKDKSLKAEDAKAYAGTIRTQIDFFFNNCNLEPKADAILHIILADLLKAAAVLEKDPLSEEGIPAAVHALHAYESHFEHPNF